MKTTDLYGSEIEAGDQIVYAIKEDNSKRPVMAVYRVMDVDNGTLRALQLNRSGIKNEEKPRLSTLRLSSTRAAITKKWNEA